MSKLKEYYLLIILALVLMGGSFYWYEFLPMRLIKSCNAKAINEAKDQKPEAVVNFYEFSYKLCLRLHGSSIK